MIPAIQLEGDNALKNVAASVASLEMEKKLKDCIAKIGIIKGAFDYTFSPTASAVYERLYFERVFILLDANNKTMELHYGKIGKSKLTTMTAYKGHYGLHKFAVERGGWRSGCRLTAPQRDTAVSAAGTIRRKLRRCCTAR